MNTTAPGTCPQCRQTVAETASEGLCPACLLGGVLARGTIAESDAEDVVPCQIDGFELRGEIARGGMGVVYRARQTDLGRDVALKMIAAADLAGPDEVRRFKLEAEAVARLDHTHIVPVYAVGESGGRPFFVMKLAEGGTLAQHPIPMANREAATIIGKVARAVHFAHERGVLHRDLKPANILLDVAGEPMVADFGLAKLAEAAASFTLSGTAVGTPGYMSPEQASGGAVATTTASDVYSLGAILYELLAGHPPFEAATALAVLRRLEAEEPVPPRSFNRAADRELETVCLRCLEKPPARRYPSAAALADDLDRWLRGEPVEARPAALSLRAARWVRRRPAMATALGLSVAATIVVLAIFTRTELAVRREKDNALAATKTARLAERNARTEAARAAASESAMRLNLYASDMAHAVIALDEGSLGVAREMLDRHIPSGTAKDLRGFEWHALQRQSMGDEAHVLRGHERGVTALAYSADGGTLATGGRDGRVQLWSTADGAALRSLPLPDAPTGVAEFPHFTAALLQSPEATDILAKDTKQYAEMRMRWRPSKLGDISGIAWSPDGKSFATAGSGSFVRVWNAGDLSIAWFLPVTEVTQIDFTITGNWLVVAREFGDGANGEIKIYDTATHRLARSIGDACSCFALTPDGTSLVVARRDGRMEIQDIESGAIAAQWTTDAPPSRLALSRDGSALATVEKADVEVALWSMRDYRRLAAFPLGADRARGVAITPDGATLITTGTSQTIRLIDVSSGKETRRLRGHEDEVLALTVAPDGRSIASGGNDRTVRLWPTAAVTEHGEILAGLTKPFAVSPDGLRVLETPAAGVVRCWRVETGDFTKLESNPSRQPLGFTADGSHFLTVQRDAGRTLIEHWTREAHSVGEPISVENLPAGWKHAVVAGPHVAFVVEKQAIHVHDIQSGRLIRRQDITAGGFSRILSSPDGRLLAAFRWPRRFTIWDLAGEHISSGWNASDATVQAFVFSPDGRYLASGGSDNLITIWDAATGKRVAALRGHKAEIQALAFTADGHTLASSAADQTLRLWHVVTWRELGVFHRGTLRTWLAFAGRDPALFALEVDRGLHVFRGR